MADCCGGGPARVLVELDYLVVGGETCDRCSDTREGVRAAVADARTALLASAVTLELVERELDPTHLADSNRVLVNGHPAEEWLGGHSTISDCPSCAELIDGFACCREIEVGGMRTEAIGREVVFDAIMAAAGLAPVGVPGQACCAATPAASGCCSSVPGEGSAPLAVTLVTAPGCGWGGSLLCDPGSEVDIALAPGSAWDMPSAWRVHVISERLRAEGIAAAVRECDLYALVDAERHAVLDVMIAEHADPPMVVVGGTVACTGGLDLEAVVRVAREVWDSGKPCC